jgi:8-oxo-dGTP diphosphatase
MPEPVTPLIAADAIIELADRPGRPIVLIERRNPPHGWAIPGGFVDLGERVEDAAVREAREETGLGVTLRVLLGVYSDPARDPRGHTVTAVYVAEARGTPKALDDARALGVFGLDAMPAPMAFDHAAVLADYIAYRTTGALTPLRLG